METSLYFIKMKAVIKPILEAGGAERDYFLWPYLFFKLFSYLEAFLKLKYSDEPDPSAFEAEFALKATWHFA